MNNLMSRTPIVVALIAAGVILIGGIIALGVFVPGSNARIVSTLTIVVPVLAISIGNLVQSFRNGRVAIETNQTAKENSAKLDQTTMQTDGIVSRLLDHVTGEVPLDTNELTQIRSSVEQSRAKGSAGGK